MLFLCDYSVLKTATSWNDWKF